VLALIGVAVPVLFTLAAAWYKDLCTQTIVVSQIQYCMHDQYSKVPLPLLSGCDLLHLHVPLFREMGGGGGGEGCSLILHHRIRQLLHPFRIQPDSCCSVFHPPLSGFSCLLLCYCESFQSIRMLKLSTGSGEYFFLPQRLGHEMRIIVPFYVGTSQVPTMTQDISPKIFVVQFSNKTIMQEIMCRTNTVNIC
jgi:hypothetical protein